MSAGMTRHDAWDEHVDLYDSLRANRESRSEALQAVCEAMRNDGLLSVHYEVLILDGEDGEYVVLLPQTQSLPERRVRGVEQQEDGSCFLLTTRI